ncbi:SRFB1 protein, partial [Alcedo cyanopectus]|nr:SRFB1 protein [Ceyx cyanopectus]
PNCTATERATARLATHPILKPRFVELKAAVKAFKDARKNPDKDTPSVQSKSGEQPKSAEQFNNSSDDQAVKLSQKQEGCEKKTKMSMKTETDRMVKQLCELEKKTVEMEKAYAPEESPFQAITQKKTGKKLGYQKKAENAGIKKSDAIKKKNNHNSDQEEEYFDDSTEERFFNQSSDSDSDSDDDFFIGKIKRKKKTAAATDLSTAKGKDRLQENILKKVKNTVPGTAEDLIMKEEKLHRKGSKLESVFCSSLCTSNQKSQNTRR